MNYGYVIGDKNKLVKVFSKRPRLTVTEDNIFYDDDDNNNVKIGIERLFEVLTENDAVVFPTLEHVGQSLSEALSLMSELLSIGVKIKLIDHDDEAFIKKMGGAEAFCSKAQDILLVQNRLLRVKIQSGINKAKRFDASLNGQTPFMRKYKGRKPHDNSVKLMVMRYKLNGMGASKISKKTGVSLRSVYNHIENVKENKQDAIKVYKYLKSIPHFTLSTSSHPYELCIDALLLDLYLLVMGINRNTSIALISLYRNSDREHSIPAFLTDLENGVIDDLIKLDVDLCLNYEEAKHCIISCVPQPLNESIRPLTIDSINTQHLQVESIKKAINSRLIEIQSPAQKSKLALMLINSGVTAIDESRLLDDLLCDVSMMLDDDPLCHYSSKPIKLAINHFIR